MKEAVACEIIRKAGRGHGRPPRKNIITQDDSMDYRPIIILRSSGDRAMKGEGGENGGDQSMGRRIAGTRIIRGGDGEHGNCMQQREEVQKGRGWQTCHDTWHEKRHLGEKVSITLYDITDKSKETRGGLIVIEDRRKERDRTPIHCNIRQKTERESMTKAGTKLSKEGRWTGQDKSMHDPREVNAQRQPEMEKKTGWEEEKAPEQSYQIQTRKGGMGKFRHPEEKQQGEEKNLGKKTKGQGGEGFSGTASFEAGQGSKATFDNKAVCPGRGRGRRGREKGRRADSQE